MKLWLLRRLPGRERDKVVGFVVRAETEVEARRVALNAPPAKGSDVWTDPKVTSCVEMTTVGGAEVVMAIVDRS